MLRHIAVLALLVGSSCDRASDTTTQSTTAQDSAGSSPPALGEVRSGTVIDVIDGDSMLVEVDGQNVEIRLVGINTPERDECGGDRASSALTEMALGQSVSISWEELDRFGRALAYVDVGDELDVAASQVEAGNAVALSINHPRFDDYAGLEVEAFSAALGMWAPRCEPTSNVGLRIAALAYDPPGPDGDDRNGEQVGVRNEGQGAVDLGGWVLRDESTQWRFVFPPGFTIPPQAGVVIHSGCGEDSEEDLFWCATDPVWNNGGDTALLLDAGGNVVDRWTYGPKG